MEIFWLILAAILPAFVLLFYIYKRDSAKPEPIGQMVKAFAMGCLSCVLVIFIELPVEWLISYVRIPVIHEILDAFFVAAIPEEGIKLLLLYLFFKQCHFFDEYFDGIVYSVCIGLGFATIENISYLLSADDWISVGITRALFTVPGHYAFAVIMGYFYSLVHFRGFKTPFYRWLVFLAPVFFHGVFDALLMVSSVPVDWSGFLIFVFLYFNYRIHRICSATITKQLQRDKEEGNI